MKPKFQKTMNFSIDSVLKQEARLKTQNEKRTYVVRDGDLVSPNKMNKSELHAQTEPEDLGTAKESKVFEEKDKEEVINSDYDSPSLKKRKKMSKQLKQKNKKKKLMENNLVRDSNNY